MFQYLMSLEYTSRIKENGFAKFQDILHGITQILNAVREARNDLYVFFLTHSETDTDAAGRKVVKAKTVGRATDQYITLEGMFTIVLYTEVRRKDNKNEYVFTTQNDGVNTAKSPMGMFPLEIPNDLLHVANRMEAYENGEVIVEEKAS